MAKNENYYTPRIEVCISPSLHVQTTSVPVASLYTSDTITIRLHNLITCRFVTLAFNALYNT